MPEYNSDTLDLTTLPFWQWAPQDYSLGEIDLGIPFDSIHRPREVADTVFRKSLFQRHSLQVNHSEALPRNDNSEPAWIFIDLMLLTGLLCLYYRLRKIKINALLKSLADLRAMDRLVRNCNLNRSMLMLPMGLLLVAVLCLPIHRMAMNETGIPGYLALFFGVGVLYILRNAILRMLGNIFDNRQGVNLYITSNYLFHLTEASVIAVLLFPFYYLPGAQTPMLYTIVVFIGIAFLMRFLRSIKVFLTQGNSSRFYLFYYLCTVETIPLLVIIKWFIVQ